MVKYVSLLSKVVLLASAVSIQSMASDAAFFEAEVGPGSPSLALPQAEFTEEELNILDRQLSALYKMKGQRLLEAGSPFEAVVYFEKARRYDLAKQVYEEEYYKTTSHGHGLDCYEKARAYERKHKQCRADWKAKGCY